VKVKSSAPGKVFLSGEYLALNGSLATILSTKQRALIHIEETDDFNNTLYCLPSHQTFTFKVNNKYKIEWVEKDPQELGLFLEWSILLTKIRPKMTRFTIDTSDFFLRGRKLGVGSSAAIALALIHAIAGYFHLKYTDEMILKTALRLHNIKQNNLGSGLDVIAAQADSGLIECVNNTEGKEKWTRLEWPSDLLIKGVITREQSATAEMIQKYYEGQIHHKEFFEKLQTDADQLLHDLSSSWKDKDIKSILELMEQYNSLMHRLNEKYDLGIYTDEHRDLANEASKLGLFYKPSGAGGGDLGFILTDDETKLKQLLTLIKDKNYQIMDLRDQSKTI